MCEPVSLSIAGGLLAGSVLSKAMKPPEMPAMQAPVSPPAPSAPPEMQAAKAPDQAAVRAQASARGNSVNAYNSTMLTGSEGVDDDDLKLGRVLLGS